MIRSAAILMAVSAIVGPGGSANAPSSANEPAASPPMTLRINANGTIAVSSLAKLFDPPPSDVTQNPAYLGPGSAAFPGAYVRDAMYREPYDRAELIARPYVSGDDQRLAGATPSSADSLDELLMRSGIVTFRPAEPAPAAPK